MDTSQTPCTDPRAFCTSSPITKNNLAGKAFSDEDTETRVVQLAEAMGLVVSDKARMQSYIHLAANLRFILPYCDTEIRTSQDSSFRHTGFFNAI